MGRVARRAALEPWAGSVVGGLAAGLWGYPAALSIGAGAVVAGLSVFAAKVLPVTGRP